MATEIVHITTDRKCLMCWKTTDPDQLIRTCRCTGWVHGHCLLRYLEIVSTICQVCHQPLTQGIFTVTNQEEGFDRGSVVYVRIVDEGPKKLLKMTRSKEGSMFVVGICKTTSGPGARMPMFILQNTNPNQ